MKRSLQEVVELVVFGLVALLVGTALLWVLGWVLSLGGALFKALAGLLWLLLRFIVPIAIVAGLVYFLVKALQSRNGEVAVAGAAGSTGSSASGSAQSAAAKTVDAVTEVAQDVAEQASDAVEAAANAVTDTVGEVAEAVSEKVDEVVETAADATEELASDSSDDADEAEGTDEKA